MSQGLHHANLLVGTPEITEARFKSICKNLGINLANNPDYFVFKIGTLGIDEARQISMLAQRKGFVGRKIFFLLPGRMTLEAQNALLKTLEDPPTGTYFFLAVREEGMVIPTLLSRMSSFHVEKSDVSSFNINTFLKLSLKKKLEFAKRFTDEGRDLGAFLDEFMSVLRVDKASRDALQSVYEVRRFAADTAVLPRIIIEHLALVV